MIIAPRLICLQWTMCRNTTPTTSNCMFFKENLLQTHDSQNEIYAPIQQSTCYLSWMQLKWQGLDPDNQREREIEWRDLVQGINVMKTQHEIERPKLNWCKAFQPKTRQNTHIKHTFKLKTKIIFTERTTKFFVAFSSLWQGLGFNDEASTTIGMNVGHSLIRLWVIGSAHCNEEYLWSLQLCWQVSHKWLAYFC